jgi:hypothetical protein
MIINGICSILSTIPLSILRQSWLNIDPATQNIYYLSLPVASILTILSGGFLRIVLMLITLWLAIATG